MYRIRKKIKVWASKGDEFAGLAELNAGKIRSISSTQILLLSKYKEDFKAHAGISFKNENGDIYVNIKKGTPSPAWLIPLQQRLCLISKVEKIDLKNNSYFSLAYFKITPHICTVLIYQRGG